MELIRDGKRIDAGPLRQRSVLAALALDAGHAVHTSTLIDRIWGECPPQRAAHTLHVYVARLRAVFTAGCEAGGRSLLSRRSAGYVLEVDPGNVDVLRFCALVASAAHAGSPAEQARLLEEGLSWWQEPPLAHMPGEWAAQVRAELEHRHLDALLSWSRATMLVPDADLGPVVRELSAALAENALVEPLVAQLMRALAADGRPADALACYASARSRIAEELGVDPSAELQEVHRAVLRGEQQRAAPPAVASAAPAQLPRDTRMFVGRGRELAWLDHLRRGLGNGAQGVVAVLTGTAGVGKSTLAVRFGHQARRHFPAGQLHVDLRGFHPNGAPADAHEVLHHFLNALGVPDDAVPAGLDARAGMYRSLLAEQPRLVILDNAAEAAQVRPLLPGDGRSMVVVTSRDGLHGLVATDDVDVLRLGLLTGEEASALLEHRIGPLRRAGEPEAFDRIVGACAGLPLALSVAAARVAARPDAGLVAMAAEIDAASTVLDVLQVGDRGIDVRAVFSWSYRQLSPPAGRLFRLMALHPGPDLTVAGMACLLAAEPAQVQPVLAELEWSSLLTEHVSGRHRMHDLLNVYAGELLDAEESADSRTAALHRLLDYYLHTAYAAALLLSGEREPISVGPPAPGVRLAGLPDTHDEALAWFAAEEAALNGMIQIAAAAGFDTHTWQLVWTMADYLTLRGNRTPVATSNRDDAHTLYRYGLYQWDKIAEPSGRARIELSLALAYSQQDVYAETLRHSRLAREIFLGVDDRAGECLALVGMWWSQLLLGEHRAALAHAHRFLRLSRQLDDSYGVASAWDAIGQTLARLGRHRAAVLCFGRAADLFECLGEVLGRAYTLQRIARSADALGRPGEARAARLEAAAALENC